MSELQPSDTRSPTQASTSKSQGLDELDQITVRLALAPKQQVCPETEPADSLFRVTDGVLKAYRLLPGGCCQVAGFIFPEDFRDQV
jgi:CRP-like cAMP-binding protein